jgi:hypothetical protein
MVIGVSRGPTGVFIANPQNLVDLLSEKHGELNPRARDSVVVAHRITTKLFRTSADALIPTGHSCQQHANLEIYRVINTKR